MKKVLFILCLLLSSQIHLYGISSPDKVERDTDYRSISFVQADIIESNLLYIHFCIPLKATKLKIWSEDNTTIYETIIHIDKPEDMYIKLNTETNTNLILEVNSSVYTDYIKL